MTSLLQLHFFQNALITGTLLSVLFGFLSFFVVMRKMSFLGAGVAHTAFGGVALGFFLGTNPFFTALIFCVLAAILISKISRSGKISLDTGIGIFFSFSMALGVVLISLKKAYTFDLTGYLFGNILGVTTFDKYAAIISLLCFLPFLFMFLHRLLFMAFDEEVAYVSGVPTAHLDTILLVFLAAIIVISIKMIGIILVSALTVLPASFGLLFSQNYRNVLIISILYTMASFWGGLILSFYLNVPAGATVVVLATVVYFVALAGKEWEKRTN